MLSVDKITEIFCLVDDFCKEIELATEGHLLKEDASKKLRNRKFKMSDSEVITILIIFHLMNYRELKHFYINYVQVHLKPEFPDTVSYNRFVELQQKVFLPMCAFLKSCCLRLHRNFFYRFHAFEGLPREKGKTAQSIQRSGHQGAVFNWLVLWLQTAYRYK